MTLAIKWGDGITGVSGGFIYFDAITSLNESHTGTVTSHPISTGSKLSDHFVRDNSKLSLSGVISAVDISNVNLSQMEGEKPYNQDGTPPFEVSVTSTDQSLLQRFIPDVFGQFLPDREPDILMDINEAVSGDEALWDSNIKFFLSRLFEDSVLEYSPQTANLESQVVVNAVEIWEISESGAVNPLFPSPGRILLATGVTFKEDMSTGGGLHCDMTFEEVTVSSLIRQPLDKKVSESLSKASAKEKKLGKKDSTPVGEDSLPDRDRDGLRTPYGESLEQYENQFRLGQPLGVGTI